MVAPFIVKESDACFSRVPSTYPRNINVNFCLDLSQVCENIPEVSTKHLEDLGLTSIGNSIAAPVKSMKNDEKIENKNTLQKSTVSTKRSRDDDNESGPRSKVARNETVDLQNLPSNVKKFINKIIMERNQLIKNNRELTSKIISFQELIKDKKCHKNSARQKF